MGSILIVDDHGDVGWLLSKLFQSAGCAAEFVTSGEAALARLGGSGGTDAGAALPDVMLLDVMMPGVDGVEVLRRVRGDARTAGLPVVMYSALSDAATADRARGAGANGYVVKGTGFEELRVTVAPYVDCAGPAGP